MNNVHGIIFGYGSPSGLRDLVEHRTASSIPFAARYRVIDFMLSSMTNAGITDIGVIMEENYQSLLDHLGAGRDWDLSRKLGGLRLLPPFASNDGFNENRKRSGGYQGWMDALSNVRSYLERIREDYIVIADGNVVSSFDLEAVFENHITTGADVTAVCTSDASALSTDVYFRFNQSGFVSEVLFGNGNEEGVTAALGVYIMSRKLLLECVDYCAERSMYNFSRDVLQRQCGHLKIGNYIVHGFAARLDTTDIYFKQSLRLLDREVRADLFPKDRPVKTKVRDVAPTYYSPDSEVNCSLVADGCYIEGTVENSIVFHGVKIARGAVIKNCVIMQDTIIGEGASLSNVITDKGVVVTAGATITGTENYPMTIAKGICV